MKFDFQRITAAILMATTLGACSANPDSASTSGDVKVLAPMNDASSKNSYSLQFIDLIGLSNLQEVSGKFVRFFFSPRIINNHLNGSAPKGRFIRNTDGNYVPGNDLSQQMVVIYAHMQRLAALDAEVGAGDVNKWPRDVGIGVRVKGGMSNNAFYDGKTDSMLFVPYTQPDLPIAANGGILAHEHFHSLFYKLVLKGLNEEASVHDRNLFLQASGISADDKHTADATPAPIGRLEARSDFRSLDKDELQEAYHTALMRGLNEGFADFWGWMYTGNPDFIAASLPSQKSVRSLEVKNADLVHTMPSELNVRRDVSFFMVNSGDSIELNSNLIGYAYTLGTQYSRVLKRLSDITKEARNLSEADARLQVGKWLVKTLPSVRAGLAAADNENFYNSAKLLDGLTESMGELQQSECEYLALVQNNSGGIIDGKKKTCKQVDSSWKVVTE
ncbi:hypothetical protein [Bdellovibrio sp. NC01]|uniref:hypothetical protein n=1 Tax=Bdellovibrio sp. NC01 TaxID=2220073 RepID=UPI00115BC22A|nr:hypothetical protein [Bdellovibrio sp. NC01]QDK39069.1 hypothetical protein DOE51_16480 [Bdellovibrio sp. NC01]